MSFRKSKYSKRKLMLFPLMDMFFILLLFFLVNIGVHEPGGDKAYVASVPSYGMGKAQILLEMLSADRVVWLDNSTFIQPDWENDFPDAHVINVSANDIETKLGQFSDTYGECLRKEVVAVIRCPDSLVYGDVEILQDTLTTVFRQVMKGFDLKLSLLGVRPEDNLRVVPLGDKEVEVKW